jgi:hypothetical protein
MELVSLRPMQSGSKCVLARLTSERVKIWSWPITCLLENKYVLRYLSDLSVPKGCRSDRPGLATDLTGDALPPS